MLYFDTSFLAPLILEETTSSAVEQFLSRLPVGTLAVSQWTQVEFCSLLGKEVRMGGLSPQAAGEASAAFDAIVAESFVVLLPTAQDFGLAKRYLGNYESGLRAGDALHLAIAKDNGAEVVFSFDRTLLKAGKALGLPVSAGIN